MRADDPSRESNAFTISGNLRGSNEQGGNEQTLAHKRFAVSLDPSNAMLLATEGADESVAEILDLGATETDGTGRFTVQIPALRGIDNYVEEDGSVGLVFQSLDDDYELMWRTPVHLPQGGETQATAAVPDEKVYKKSLGKKTIARPPDRMTADGQLDLSAPVRSVAPSPVAVNDLALTGLVTSSTTNAAASTTGRNVLAAADVGSGEKAKACKAAMGNTPWDSYGWKKKGPVYREWIPVQRAQTGDQTTMKYEWSNTKETSVEILAKLGYAGGGAGAAMSAGSAKSIKASSGLTFEVGHDVVRDLDAEYDFATYTLRCKVSGSDIYRDTKLTKVQMYQFKGFSRKNHYTGYYTCPNSRFKGPIPAQLWVSRDSTSTFSFSLGANGSYKGLGADVSLTSKQTNTASHKKTYIEVKAGAVLCGQNGNPTVTEKVSETS